MLKSQYFEKSQLISSNLMCLSFLLLPSLHTVPEVWVEHTGCSPTSVHQPFRARYKASGHERCFCRAGKGDDAWHSEMCSLR
jgi:hypothetical protein